MDDTPEREVLPGIYLTDFRSSASSSSSSQPEHKDEKTSSSSSSSPPSSSGSSDVSDVNQLSFDLAQLQNSIDHLIASNNELREFMEGGDDEDGTYAKAIHENMGVIDRQQERAFQLQQLLDEARAGHAVDKRQQPPSSSSSTDASNDGVYL